MNKVFLLGNVGALPELRTTQKGSNVCNFTLATSRKVNGVDSVTWHKVVVWGKPAEACAKHVGVGSKVLVEGEIVVRDYTDKQGAARKSFEIHTFSHVQFLSKGREQAAKPDDRSVDAFMQAEGLDDLPF